MPHAAYGAWMSFTRTRVFTSCPPDVHLRALLRFHLRENFIRPFTRPGASSMAAVRSGVLAGVWGVMLGYWVLDLGPSSDVGVSFIAKATV